MEKRHFIVAVEGQYIALGEASGVPTVKNYRMEFNLPSQEAALSVICKHLLAPALRKKYSDFIRYRTHKLVSINAIGRKPDTGVLQMGIDEMSIDQLSDFCILRNILIDPYRHTDLPLTREKVAEAWRAQRQSRQEAQASGATKEQKDIDSLLAANKLEKEGETPQVNINERVAVAPGKPEAHSSVALQDPIEADEKLPPFEPDAKMPNGDQELFE